MARRRHKKRTHLHTHGESFDGIMANLSASRSPKSMVIRVGAGETGSSVSQLVKDVRRMMEPGTASRLKERKSNKLRDYTTMAGPLGVSHLLLFSRSSTGNTNLRLALTPRGPTLHFRVEKYALCKDLRKTMRHPKGGGREYLSSPLLVMNNFTSPEADNGSKSSVPRHLETLSTTIFQSLFPPISPQTTALSSIRRVLLLNREFPKPQATADGIDVSPYVINLRHYAITSSPLGLSKGIHRISAAQKMLKDRASKKRIPNLGKLEDVADYILDPSVAGAGLTSGSESEIETDAEVEVIDVDLKKVIGRNQANVLRKNDRETSNGGTGTQKRAIRLVELGPRLSLRMTKVEEGVCGGKVMWHEYVNKTEDEVREMEKVWETRNREKTERKRIQRENVQRKRKARATGEKPPEDTRNGTQIYDSDDSHDWESDAPEAEDQGGRG
ncbi:MAG: hypothetical protein LQ352_001066 [Teloschistes flavicans]|nr:MAG: hypothetical protein LQ352_001066 [Teloschistes flavicans]